jgi:hypothetical protein
MKTLLIEQHMRVTAANEVIRHVAWVGEFSDSPVIRHVGENLMRTWPTVPRFIHDTGIS